MPSPRPSRAAWAEGFEVDVVHDGLDGLDRARDDHYDADRARHPPAGMNGYKVCETLRDEGVWTPILMLTAKDGEYDEAEALDTGADDFLSKPFSFVVLVARLRALAAPRPRPRPTPLEVGDLRSTRRPHVPPRRREIALTRREFALLEALMRHAGEVVVQARAARRGVGRGVRGRPQRRRGLRRVPAPQDRRAFERRTIHTVRGTGYRIATMDPTEAGATGTDDR